MLLLIISHRARHFSQMPVDYNSGTYLRQELESHGKIGREGRFAILEEEVWLWASLSSSFCVRAQTMQYSRDR